MRISGVEILTVPDRGDSMMLVAVDTTEGISGLGEVGTRTRQEAILAGWAEGHYIRTATHNPLGPVMTAACTEFNIACASFGIQEQHDHGPRPDLDGVFTRRPVVEPGRAFASEAPGLGVEIGRAVARDLTAKALERRHLRRRDGSFTNW